jgi:hypothetical protein
MLFKNMINPVIDEYPCSKSAKMCADRLNKQFKNMFSSTSLALSSCDIKEEKEKYRVDLYYVVHHLTNDEALIISNIIREICKRLSDTDYYEIVKLNNIRDEFIYHPGLFQVIQIHT